MTMQGRPAVLEPHPNTHPVEGMLENRAGAPGGGAGCPAPVGYPVGRTVTAQIAAPDVAETVLVVRESDSVNVEAPLAVVETYVRVYVSVEIVVTYMPNATVGVGPGEVIDGSTGSAAALVFDHIEAASATAMVPSIKGVSRCQIMLNSQTEGLLGVGKAPGVG